LNIDPDDAINQATAIRADIASGFGIQFQSSKYRKQAQQMIAQQLAQADTIIAQIRASAEIARGAADRSKRILPEFAGGNYFADYFKPNGLLPGMFDGRDNILAMISRGEMVLNPGQQRSVRALAGFDVFAGAGIPNYPNPSASTKFASGGIAGGFGQGNIVVQPNFSDARRRSDRPAHRRLYHRRRRQTNAGQGRHKGDDGDETINGTSSYIDDGPDPRQPDTRDIDWTIELTFPDVTGFKFATSPMTISRGTFTNDLETISEIRQTLDAAVDRVTVGIQNKDRVIGLDVAANWRKWRNCEAVIGRVYYEDRRYKTGVSEWIEMFRGTVQQPNADDLQVTFDVIPDTIAPG
jgi:hypothetical protein